MLSQGFRITPVHFSTDYITNTPFLYFFFYLFCLSMLHCLHQWPCRRWRSREWMDGCDTALQDSSESEAADCQSTRPSKVCLSGWTAGWSLCQVTDLESTVAPHQVAASFLSSSKQTRSTFSAALVVVGGRNFSKVAVNRGLLISGEF